MASGADAGLAFDGDAIGVLRGPLGHGLDGDHLIAICALDRHHRGLLVEDTVGGHRHDQPRAVRLAMEEHGIRVEETAVGDRYVVEALARGGWSLGASSPGT